jgi:hypothetical protein
MKRTLFIVISRRLGDGYMMAGLKIEQPAPTGCACCCVEKNFRCSAGIRTSESAAAQYSMTESHTRKLMPNICNRQA